MDSSTILDEHHHTTSMSTESAPLLAQQKAPINTTKTTVSIGILGDEGGKNQNGSDVVTQEENDHSPESSTATTQHKLTLAALIVAYIVMSILSTIGRKLSIDAFGSHLAFFRQISGNFLYNVWCSFVVLYKLRFTDDISAEQRAIYPLYVFALIGFFDGFSDFLTNVGGIHSPGSLQTLLSQLVIPITLLLAYLIMKTRFKWSEMAGALVILLGVCLATIPQFEGRNKGSAEGQKTYWYSIIVFAAGQVPTAASVVAKDYIFKGGALDVFYLSCLVSWTQLFITWIFVPLESIHALGGVPMKDIGGVMSDGFRCLMGEHGIPKNRPAMEALAAAQLANTTIDYCRGAYVPAVTFSYSIGGFIQGILQLYIVKWHSATLAMLCQAITLPLSNLAYSIPAFFGSEAEPFSGWDVAGLIITVGGLLLYRLQAIRERFLLEKQK